jgi:hypothetical protein
MHLGERWSSKQDESDADETEGDALAHKEEVTVALPVAKATEVSHLHRVFLDQIGPSSFVLVDIVTHESCRLPDSEHTYELCICDTDDYMCIVTSNDDEPTLEISDFHKLILLEREGHSDT